MSKKKTKRNEFYCTECGCIQKSIKENDKWETYSPNCQNCGSKNISIRIVESEE